MLGVQDRQAASRIFVEAASPEIHQEIAGRSQFQTLPHQANTHCDREHVAQLRSDFSMFQKNGCYYPFDRQWPHYRTAIGKEHVGTNQRMPKNCLPVDPQQGTIQASCIGKQLSKESQLFETCYGQCSAWLLGILCKYAQVPTQKTCPKSVSVHRVKFQWVQSHPSLTHDLRRATGSSVPAKSSARRLVHTALHSLNSSSCQERNGLWWEMCWNSTMKKWH